MMADVELWSLETDGYLLYSLQRIDVLMGFDLDELELVDMPDGSTAEVAPSYTEEFGYDFNSDKWQPLIASTYEDIVASGRTVLCRLSSLNMLISPELEEREGVDGLGGEVVWSSTNIEYTVDFQAFIEAYGWSNDELGEFELVTVDRYFLLGPDEIEDTLEAMVVQANQYTDGGVTTSSGVPVDTILYYPIIQTEDVDITYHLVDGMNPTRTPIELTMTFSYEYTTSMALYTGYYYTTGTGTYRAGQVPDPSAETGTATSETDEGFSTLYSLMDAMAESAIENAEYFNSIASGTGTYGTDPVIYPANASSPGYACGGSTGTMVATGPVIPMRGMDPATGEDYSVCHDGRDTFNPDHIYYIPHRLKYWTRNLGSAYAGGQDIVYEKYGDASYPNSWDSGDDLWCIINGVHDVVYWPTGRASNYTDYAGITLVGTDSATGSDNIWTDTFHARIDIANILYFTAGGTAGGATATTDRGRALFEVYSFNPEVTIGPAGVPTLGGVTENVPAPYLVSTTVDYAINPGEDPEQVEENVYQGHRLYTAAQFASEFTVSVLEATAGEVLDLGTLSTHMRTTGGSAWPPSVP